MSLACYKDYSMVIGVAYQEYWRLDSLSGGNYLGSFQNTPMVPTNIGSVAGIISNGSGFVSNTSKLATASNSSMGMSASVGVSMSMWLLCTLGGVAANGLTIDWTLSDLSRIRMTVSSFTLSFGGEWHAAGGLSAFFDVNSTANVWHHVVVTYDKVSQNFTMYFDGASVYVVGLISSPGAAATGTINQTCTITTSGFEVDEVGVWGDHVLSAAEVTAMWNGGAGARPTGA